MRSVVSMPLLSMLCLFVLSISSAANAREHWPDFHVTCKPDLSAEWEERGSQAHKLCARFIPGWFAGQCVYRYLAPWLSNRASSRFVELGALFGQSSCYMAQLVHGKSNPQFDVIDIWGPAEEYTWLRDIPSRGYITSKYGQWEALNEHDGLLNAWLHYMNITNSSHRISRHTQGSSVDSRVLSEYQDASIDAIYLDTSHAYEQTKEELRLWWPKVKPDGWFCGDDYKQVYLALVDSKTEGFMGAQKPKDFGNNQWCIWKQPARYTHNRIQHPQHPTPGVGGAVHMKWRIE